MSPQRQSDPDLEQNLVVRSLAMRLPGGTRIGAHDHTWPQLVYATHGVVTVSTAYGAWVVPPQRAVWVPPDTEHTIETMGTVAMRTLYLRPGKPSARPGPCCVLHVTPLLRELVLEIVRVGMLDMRVPAQLHLADVLRDQLGGATSVPADLVLPRDPRARRVAERVRANPGGRESLASLASGCGAAPRTVERLFQRETSMSFGRWRQHARLVHAVGLLAEGEAVTDVAAQAGYDSTSAFISMFKRTLGKTPGQYFTTVPEPT